LDFDARARNCPTKRPLDRRFWGSIEAASRRRSVTTAGVDRQIVLKTIADEHGSQVTRGAGLDRIRQYIRNEFAGRFPRRDGLRIGPRLADGHEKCTTELTFNRTISLLHDNP
jgi:hypothetical protein